MSPSRALKSEISHAQQGIWFLKEKLGADQDESSLK